MNLEILLEPPKEGGRAHCAEVEMGIPRLVSAFFAALFITACSHAATQPPAAPKAPKPEVDLRVTLPSRTYFPGNPVRIFAQLVIKNGGEEFYCLAVEWKVNGENTDRRESDCEPYDAANRPEFDHETSSKEFWFAAGEYNISATLYRSGRKVMELSKTVSIR